MTKSYQICCPKCNNHQNFYRYGKDKYGNQKYLCRVCGHQFAPDAHAADKPGRPRVRPYPTCPVCGKAMFLHHDHKYYSNYQCCDKKCGHSIFVPKPAAVTAPSMSKLSGKTDFKRMRYPVHVILTALSMFYLGKTLPIYNVQTDECNHSNTHPHMPKLTQQEMTAQITECNKKIMAITGKSPLLFRPPYGDYNNAVIDTVNSLKMYPIQWDVDSLDWKDPTPQQISSRVISKVKPGSIILMHNGAKNTPQALPTILQTLQSQGYQFVRISELIYKDNYTIDNAGKQIPNQSAPHKTSSASSMAVSTSTK
jgi:hypothetical protein